MRQVIGIDIGRRDMGLTRRCTLEATLGHRRLDWIRQVEWVDKHTRDALATAALPSYPKAFVSPLRQDRLRVFSSIGAVVCSDVGDVPPGLR